MALSRAHHVVVTDRFLYIILILESIMPKFVLNAQGIEKLFAVLVADMGKWLSIMSLFKGKGQLLQMPILMGTFHMAR